MNVSLHQCKGLKDFMYSDKETANLLAYLCQNAGVQHAVISPGSRNAPLIMAFTNQQNIECHSIIDERSAGFYALGIAVQSGKPVVLICTSGTAPLNYAPAMAEAFYQKVPLIVISADRPAYWINKGEGQTIDQKNIFKNFSRKFLQLPLEADDNTVQEIWETLNTTLFPVPRPVHINVPFEEPLYGTTKMFDKPEIQDLPNAKHQAGRIPTDREKFLNRALARKNILVLCGGLKSDRNLNKALTNWGNSGNTVILTETTANLHDDSFIPFIDKVIVQFEKKGNGFLPDIVITIGGTLISKKVKSWLRKHFKGEHWHLSADTFKVDTFDKLTRQINTSPAHFFEQIKPSGQSEYRQKWRSHISNIEESHDRFLSKTAFSDLKVFSILSGTLKATIALHLANSTPVRYAQLFRWHQQIEHFGNRGTSGIDGSSSTAAGFAGLSDKTNVLITGDISFLYDSNAFLNNHIPPNLKIIVINNGGGNIFRFLEGPSKIKGFETFFETHIEKDIKKMCDFYGLQYFDAGNESETLESLNLLLQSKTCSVLEIRTPRFENDLILKDYFKFLTHDQ
jgi:2-succinyl-5-enolpyruvyl-6-hydroxy-3-cyclohexene-1-carboxylate synthase